MSIIPYKKTKTIVKAKRTYKRKPPSKDLILRVVKNYESRQLETKQQTVSMTYTLFNSSIGSVSEFYPLMPAVIAGTSNNNRIGDTIQPTKLIIRGYISFASDSNINAQEIISRMFVLQDKSVKNYNLLTSMSIKILDNGATDVPFTGSLLDIIMPQNKKRFRFFSDRKHTFLKSYGYTNPTTGTSQVSMHSSTVKYFTVTLTPKHLPAKLTYDPSDNNAYPLNFAPFIALGYAYAQNNTPDNIETKIGMSYTSTLYYKDA